MNRYEFQISDGLPKLLLRNTEGQIHEEVIDGYYFRAYPCNDGKWRGWVDHEKYRKERGVDHLKLHVFKEGQDTIADLSNAMESWFVENLPSGKWK